MHAREIDGKPVCFLIDYTGTFNILNGNQREVRELPRRKPNNCFVHGFIRRVFAVSASIVVQAVCIFP